MTVPLATPAAEAGATLPGYGFAKAQGVVVLDAGAEGGPARVGLREGGNAAALAELRRLLGRPFEVVMLGGSAFERELSARYGVSDSATRSLAADLGASDTLDHLAGEADMTADLLDSADDAPVVRLINGLIAEAIRQGASDIHIEPFESDLVVRLRTDGVLREVLRLAARTSARLVSRIKVMARLDIAERRLPQDGRMSLTLGGRAVDVRVSTLPARHGERVVLRLLEKDQTLRSLGGLGLAPGGLAALRQALALPNGIILVCGPTGSGKTTTLYAALETLNDGSRNILTVEDPVEYAIAGIGQTQVNARIGMSFAAGLRAILRQDPDIVMVGEIRDGETAQIAVQASLTGHLVLSTVHTNDAIGAITRLRDLGVEPFLLASTVRAIVAQRLVRRLCQACRRPVAASAAERRLLGPLLPEAAPLYAPVGCPACNHSGYGGRIGLYEVVALDDPLRRMIHDDAPEADMAAHAFRDSDPLLTAGLRHVADGVTSLAEVLRTLGRGIDAADGAG